jgi:hypothetical protein
MLRGGSYWLDGVVLHPAANVAITARNSVRCFIFKGIENLMIIPQI